MRPAYLDRRRGRWCGMKDGRVEEKDWTYGRNDGWKDGQTNSLIDISRKKNNERPTTKEKKRKKECLEEGGKREK